MTTPDTRQSLSRRTAVVGLAAGGLGVALAATVRSASAQDATPAAMAAHPIVGGWQGFNAPVDPIATTYALFHADGTYLEVTVGAGTGVWRATGARTADLTTFYQDVNPDPTAYAPGTSIRRQSIEVDATGNTATAPYTAELIAPDGTVLVAAGPVDGRFVRLEVEPMVPFETPAAGTPTA